jgi:5-methylcytosine-specific restriction endonuclease McrA
MNIEEVLASPVLVINAKWQAVGTTTVMEALADMCSGKATAIDTELMSATKWDEWLALPVRAGDRQIKSLRGAVRVPTVVGKFSYAKMPKKRPKLDNRGIKERDGAICQVTGRYAPDGNVDHLNPKSRGGAKKSWTNQVWMSRELNTEKGSRTLEEMDWRLIRPPTKPPEKDVCLLIKPRHSDWRMFLPKP